jgi:DNA-binding transcriptional ArsR family regulator
MSSPSPASEQALDRAAHALADSTRRSILRLVRDEERSAGELAAEFPQMSRPAVSQHLRVLHDAGLVAVRPEGNHRMYRARTDGLDDVMGFLQEMWSDRLARLKRAAEQAEWPKRQRTSKTKG